MKKYKTAFQKYPRRPFIRYDVFGSLDSDPYLVVRTRDTRTNRPTSRTVYKNEHMPDWVREGVQLLDMGKDGQHGASWIPGFGASLGHTYVFYEEGFGIDKPYAFDGWSTLKG